MNLVYKSFKKKRFFLGRGNNNSKSPESQQSLLKEQQEIQCVDCGLGSQGKRQEVSQRHKQGSKEAGP